MRRPALQRAAAVAALAVGLLTGGLMGTDVSRAGDYARAEAAGDAGMELVLDALSGMPADSIAADVYSLSGNSN
jgi:hypothetical protein